MTTKATTNTVTYATDSYRTAVQKIYTELDLLWAQINTVHKLQATTGAEPTDNSTGDLWLNMDPTLVVPQLEYYDGAAFQAITGGDQLGTGVTLDNFIRGYSKNAVLYPSASAVYVEGSSTTPVTIGVGTALLQNTSRTTCSFSGAAAGKYDIYVDRASEGSTTFTLKKAAVGSLGGYTTASDERTVGYAIWDGSDFSYLESIENRISYPAVLRSSGAAVTIPSGGWTQFNEFTATPTFPRDPTMGLDPWGCVSSGIYTPKRTGVYKIDVFFRVDIAGKTGNDIYAKLALNSSPAITNLSPEVAVDMENSIIALSETVVLNNITEGVGLYFSQSSGSSVDLIDAVPTFSIHRIG